MNRIVADINELQNNILKSKNNIMKANIVYDAISPSIESILFGINSIDNNNSDTSEQIVKNSLMLYIDNEKSRIRTLGHIIALMESEYLQTVDK